MSHVLVKFRKDWADEFDVYGFAVCSADEWETLKPKIANQRDMSFGTNEGWESSDFCEDESFLDDCTVIDITEVEASMLIRLFNLRKYDWQNVASWGVFPQGN